MRPILCRYTSVSVKVSDPARESPKIWNNWNCKTSVPCWRSFHDVKMTGEAAHAFCLQHGGRLANFTNVEDIRKNSSILSNGRKYWISTDNKIETYFPKDPLQGWYWPNGSLLNANRRWSLSGTVEYTGGEERCAFIHYKNDIIFWKDSPCDSRHWFVCTKEERLSYMVRFITS